MSLASPVVPVNVNVAPTLGVSETFWFRNYAERKAESVFDLL